MSCSHIYVELSNPTNNGAAGAFWPAMAEIELWAVEEKEETSLMNVASSAAITSVGNAGSSSNLVDENYSTLYVYNNGGISTLPGGVAWIEMELDREYPVVSMEAAFEEVTPDANDFHFKFDILGKSKSDTEWQPLFTDVTATRLTGDNIKELADTDTVRAGLYLRDTDIYENSTADIKDIYMEMGSSDIAHELGTALDSEWAPHLVINDDNDFSFYTVPMESKELYPDKPV